MFIWYEDTDILEVRGRTAIADPVDIRSTSRKISAFIKDCVDDNFRVEDITTGKVDRLGPEDTGSNRSHLFLLINIACSKYRPLW